MPKVRLFSSEVKAATALLALFSPPVLADETIRDDMVVTANRVETESSKIGAAVTVITAEQIERSQKKTVADVLRGVPGLAVSQTGGTGTNTAIRIRGAESYHTKLIIDGVDLSDPSKSQPQYEFGNLLAADIERIEVVRGPQSLLYGGDAMGGVIAITTRKGKGKPRVTANAEIGSHHTYQAGTSVSGSEGRVSYALGITHFETDGISAASKRTGNDENDPFTNDTVNAKLGLALTEFWDVEATGRFTRAKVDYDDWTTRAVDDSDSMRTMERSGRLATNLALLDGRFRNSLAYSLSEAERDIDNGRSFFGSRYSTFDGESQKVEYQGTAKLAPDNHTLVFGAEYKQDGTDQSGIVKDVTDIGYYADYQFSPVESLFLTLGGRVDDHETFGTHKTGRATAAYLVDATATRLHGSYGTGFRAPSLYELYHPTYGNTGLKPEESRGWDFGVEQQVLNGRGAVDVTWFDNRIENLIQWRNNKYINLTSTRARGIEAGGHVDVSQSVRLNATYTFTDSRNNGTGQMLARRPKHQGMLGVAWEPQEGVTTDAGMRVVGRQYDSATSNYLGGFVTFDMSAAWQVTEWAKLYGRVENLLDKQYEEVDTYGTPGRTLFAGVKAAF